MLTAIHKSVKLNVKFYVNMPFLEQMATVSSGSQILHLKILGITVHNAIISSLSKVIMPYASYEFHNIPAHPHSPESALCDNRILQ